MVLNDDDETLSQSPRNTETWNTPDPSSPQAAVFPNKLDRQYLRPPNTFYLYTAFLGQKPWEHTVMQRVSQHLDMARNILRRNPTQEEINAFVEHTSHEVNMRGLGLPIGLGAGFAHSFYFIRKKLNIPKNLPILQGIQQVWPQMVKTDRRALVFQAALRTSFWVLLSMGNFQGFATYRFSMGLSTDPRLAAFRDAVRKYADARMQRLEGNSEQARQRREVREAARHPATASAEEYPQPEYGRGRESSTPSSTTSSVGGSDSVWGREQKKQSVFTDSVFQDDDASPVAYELKKQESADDYSTSTNSWERIRQERAAQQKQMPVNSPAEWRKRAFRQVEEEQSQNPSTDYATEERYRQQEREAAQKEFDRMLDAERQASQGDGSNSSENNQTGWRRW